MATVQASAPPPMGNTAALEFAPQDLEKNHTHRLSQISTASSSNSKRAKAHIGPWQLGRTLGRGSSGRVRLAKNAETGQLAAVKIVPKATTKDDKGDASPQGIEREVIIMKLIEHPNIMALYDVWENKGELYLVLEYVEGGELFDYLVSRGRLSEHEAVHYFRQICYGVSYCHKFNICHRDLKPENLLLDKHRNIKIADFGMAALETNERMLETSCGSPHYASPEIVAGKNYHGAPSDIWSCGIILFALLTGHLPFDDDNIRQLLLKVQSGKYSMPSTLSKEARDLISRILRVDPADRITMPEILAHPLLQKYPSKHVPEENELIRNQLLLDASQPVPSIDQIDRDILRQLQTLWHREDPVRIVQRLLSPEPNAEKTFYCLLTTFRQKHGVSLDVAPPANSTSRHRRNVSTSSKASRASKASRTSKSSKRSLRSQRGHSVRHSHHPHRSGSKFSVTSMSSRRTRAQLSSRRDPANVSTQEASPEKRVRKEREQFADMLDLAFNFGDVPERRAVSDPHQPRALPVVKPRSASEETPSPRPVVAPVEPVRPVQPVQPVRPVQPVQQPVAPVAPVAPVQPQQYPQQAFAQPNREVQNHQTQQSESQGRTQAPPSVQDQRQKLEDKTLAQFQSKTLDPWHAEPKYLLPIVFEEDRFADALEEEMELKVYKRRRRPQLTTPTPHAANTSVNTEGDSRLQIANLASGDSFYSYQPSAAAAAVPPPQRPAPAAPNHRSQLSHSSFAGNDLGMHIPFHGGPPSVVSSTGSREAVRRKPSPVDRVSSGQALPVTFQLPQDNQQNHASTALNGPRMGPPSQTQNAPRTPLQNQINQNLNQPAPKRQPLAPRETNVESAPKPKWFRRFTPKRLSSGPKQQNLVVEAKPEREEEVRQNWFLKMLNGHPDQSSSGSRTRTISSKMKLPQFYEAVLQVLRDASPHGVSASAPALSESAKKPIVVVVSRRNSLNLKPGTLGIWLNAQSGGCTATFKFKRGSGTTFTRIVDEIERSLRRLNA